MTELLRRGAALGLCAALTASLLAQSSNPLPPDRAAGAATVDEAQLREWLGTLASPEFGGRGTGQEGFRLAADYVRAHFEALGLEPGAEDGSYLQVVPWVRTAAIAERTALTVERDGETLWRLDAASGLRGSASVDEQDRGELTIVVTGSPTGEDLTQLDLSGAGVLAVVRAGLLGGETGRRASMSARRNFNSLRNNVGAAGGKLLAVVDDAAADLFGAFEGTDGPDRQSGGRAGAGRGRMPSSTAIRRADLAALLAAAGVEVDVDAGDAPARHRVAGVEAALTVDIETTQAPAWNVLAILRGSDPELRDEFVGVGCHLDHLGRQGDTIWPGADDDGSGSTGLMAISQAFAKNPHRPKRSVLFMAFCGEEKGLVGSAYFARNPTIPLEKMVAELQIDMIGRNEEGRDESAADNLNSVHLVGSQKLSSDLHELCLRLNDERARFDLEWDEEDVFYRSDHWNFAREGVPIAFFFTGFHPDYHQPSDTPDKIDYAKLLRISRYVYDIAYELADAAERPMVDAQRWEELARKGRQEPVAPVRK